MHRMTAPFTDLYPLIMKRDASKNSWQFLPFPIARVFQSLMHLQAGPTMQT
jgi:hypothetical protein